MLIRSELNFLYFITVKKNRNFIMSLLYIIVRAQIIDVRPTNDRGLTKKKKNN